MLPNWLQSSSDPSSVSRTVTGLVLSSSSFIVLIGARLFNMEMSAEDVTSFATGIGMLAGGMWFVHGLIMKVLVRFGKK